MFVDGSSHSSRSHKQGVSTTFYVCICRRKNIFLGRVIYCTQPIHCFALFFTLAEKEKERRRLAQRIVSLSFLSFSFLFLSKKKKNIFSSLLLSPVYNLREEVKERKKEIAPCSLSQFLIFTSLPTCFWYFDLFIFFCQQFVTPSHPNHNPNAKWRPKWTRWT